MNEFRRKQAWNKRDEANQMANQRPHPRHIANGEENKFRHKKGDEVHKCHEHDYKEWMNQPWVQDHKPDAKPIDIAGKPSHMMTFTKGMPHNKQTGLLTNPLHFQYFVRAIDSGDPRDFRDTPLGPDEQMGKMYNCHPPKTDWMSFKARHGKSKDPKKRLTKDGESVGLRAWESQSAGLAYELEGPDAQAVTMPPAPALGSDELTAEMAEVYCQALLRDIPFTAFSAGVIEPGYCVSKEDHLVKHAMSNAGELKKLHCNKGELDKVLEHCNLLRPLDWFTDKDLKLDPQEEARRCMRQFPTPATAFRGITKGDDVGPYLSQFLLVGNTGINGFDPERDVEAGMITYGAISIEQKVRVAVKGKDYMTSWEEWLDVQQAANVTRLEEYSDDPQRRFIHTPRDLATYVHYDALYEAYLNACLILLGMGMPFDPGIPFQDDDSRDHQQGFAHFGGPHILSLVTEVATRALKAVRFQKYNVHRRCRPEVLAARITKTEDLKNMAKELPQVESDLEPILKKIAAWNCKQNIGKTASDLKHTKKLGDKNYLLPMAFCEGSPMHPAYGAGHATVAGACVTILKAFFDCQAILDVTGDGGKKAFVSYNHGTELKSVPVFDRFCQPAHLTVEGELNKLASNISIGRDWAGVHYFSDYYESLLMGEQIAIGILEEQKLMFNENFSMTIPLFGGGSLRI